METNKLRIYRDTIDFMELVHNISRNMPRFERYSIGIKMFNDSLLLVQHIAKANRSEEERVHWLIEYLVVFESIKALMQIAVDKHLISARNLEKLILKIQCVEKQATAWKKSAMLKSGIENG